MKLKPRTSFRAGVLLLATALVANPFVLGRWLAPDRSIDSSWLVIVIILGEAVLATISMFLLVRRPSVTLERRQIWLATIGLLLGLVAAELLVTVWLDTLASERQVALYESAEEIRAENPLRWAPHPYIGYIPNPGYERDGNYHNDLGYRGGFIEIPKPRGTYRIALLGGSTTYGVTVDSVVHSYPYLLERRLREAGRGHVEIINAGADSYTSWESLVNLAFRVLDLQPDAVLINHGINDVHPRLVYPYERFRGDNAASTLEVSFQQSESVLYRSSLVRLVATILGIRRPAGFLVTYQGTKDNYAAEFEVQKRRGVYPSGVFVDHPVSEMLARNKPVYFERNLRSMIAIARAHGVRPILMTFPWSSLFPDEPRVSSPEYQGALRQHNEVVKKLCGELEVTCLDLAAEMPIRRELWVDGRHVTREGAALKARIVARLLISAIPVDGGRWLESDTGSGHSPPGAQSNVYPKAATSVR